MEDKTKLIEENVLYEDNHIIVVLKPQNIPSCEDESKDEDMLTKVKKYINEFQIILDVIIMYDFWRKI